MKHCDILIIGGGPAGLTAALYAGRAGASVTVLESTVCGGQIINAPLVENYPGRPQVSGVELVMDLMGQASAFGAEILYEKAISLHREEDRFTVTVQSGEIFSARSVILATGRVHRNLGLPREELLVGHGVSYCAACDGGFFRGEDVAVAGGGNTALGDALYLAPLCRHVTLIHRRQEFRGDIHTLHRLQETENVTILTEASVTELRGEDRLEGITVSHRGKTVEIPVKGLFIAVGQQPQNGWLEEDLLKDGYVAADESCRTPLPGLFTAGDCRTKEVYQLSTAVADGTVASLAALRYLRENEPHR